MKIALTTSLPSSGFSRLAGHELGSPMSEAEVLVSTFDYKVSSDLISSCPHLRLIANFGAGFNNIDLDTCRERGIYVTNTPTPVIEPTAELAFALMHAVARRTCEMDRKLREHRAEPFGVMNNLGHTLYGKVLGIIGMGNIGKAIARRAIASGMTILYHNRHRLDKSIEALYGATYVTLEELLTQADFVSLNLPYTLATHHIINAHSFSMMKNSAYLINTARGAHVDEQALIVALRNKQIAGAALDVYEFEPNISAELLTLDQVVLSPHIGTGTMEGRLDMCENVVDNILAFERGDYHAMNIVLEGKNTLINH